MNPFFSIVIPTYNRASFLPGITASIQKQGITDYEVIFVDDGSQDNTKDVVMALSDGDKRINYVYQENKERGAARNKGILNAQGTFILLVDSDDELDEKYLNYLKEAIEAKPGFDFYACKFKLKKGKRIYSTPIESAKEGILDYRFFLHGNPLACNICFRKSNPALLLFEEDRQLATMEDWIFIFRNLRKQNLYLLNRIGLYMNEHEGRSMQQNQLLIERRIRATELLIRQVTLSEEERKTLWGYSYHFCSIHAYIDRKRKQSLFYLMQAIKYTGWNKKFAVSFAKYLIGKNFIELLKPFVP